MKKLLIVLFVLFLLKSNAQSAPEYYYRSNVPDYSQHIKTSWSGYCVPTSTGDALSWFASNGYPELMPAGTGAIQLIEGLASAMQTNGGTSFENAVSGIQTFIDSKNAGVSARPNDGLVVDYRYVWDNGAPSWNWLTTELSSGAGLLLMGTYYWTNHNPFGHATTVVGYGESFTDLNGNGYYDAGEPFVDKYIDGRYDPNAFTIHDPDDHDQTTDDTYLMNLYNVSYYDENDVFMGIIPQLGYTWSYSGYTGTAIIDGIISIAPYDPGELDYGPGSTVPEPATIMLFSLPVLYLFRKKSKK